MSAVFNWNKLDLVFLRIDLLGLLERDIFILVNFRVNYCLVIFLFVIPAGIFSDSKNAPTKRGSVRFLHLFLLLRYPDGLSELLYCNIFYVVYTVT